MGGLEFVAALVDSLAWPILVLVLVLILRAPIAKVLTERPLKRLKAGPGGVEMEWEERLEELRAEIETAIPALPEDVTEEYPPDAPDDLSDLLQVAELSPRAAVLESFSRLEALLREVVSREAGRRPSSTRALARRAADLGVLSLEQVAIVDDLAVLRNVAAHEGLELDRSKGVEYVLVLRRLLHSIGERSDEAMRRRAIEE